MFVNMAVDLCKTFRANGPAMTAMTAMNATSFDRLRQPIHDAAQTNRRREEIVLGVPGGSLIVVKPA
jgi:hypothetical protein